MIRLPSHPLFTCKRFQPNLLRLPPLRRPPAHLPSMEPPTTTTEAEPAASSGDTINRVNYPKPLSPPYPSISKDVELSRAMSAAARSGAYTLSPSSIVFEDEWLVVANKPSGIYCETFLSSLSNASSELHLANRLDRDTSGLMVITKSHKAAAKLVKAFTDHTVKKTYLALCAGNAPNWERIRISSGHGRSRYGAWRVYSESDVGRTLPGGSHVRHMATAFEVLAVNGRGELTPPAEIDVDGVESVVVYDGESLNGDSEKREDDVLIRAYPQSGRTHQIRLHCQYLGVPIRGDVKYGGVHEWKGITCDAHALHAESLSFEHPITGLPVRFRAPLPLWVSEVWGTMVAES